MFPVTLLLCLNIVTSFLFTNRIARCNLYLSALENTSDVVDLLKSKITAALEPVKLEINSDSTDPNGMHVSISIVSKAFYGKRSMQRQQLVYKAIWEEMQDGGPVHAVDTIIAKAPGE